MARAAERNNANEPMNRLHECRAGFPACRFAGLSSPVDLRLATRKPPNPHAGKPALRGRPGSWANAEDLREMERFNTRLILFLLLLRALRRRLVVVSSV